MKDEHTEMLPECLTTFGLIHADLTDIKDNHLAHINDKIDSNTKWTKWGIGLVITAISIGFALLGIVISLGR